MREQTIFFQVQIKYVGHFSCESHNPSRAAVLWQPHKLMTQVNRKYV